MTASTSNFEQRDFVIRELLDTETNYLEVLNALRYKFMQPLERLLSKDELRVIFPRIRELSTIHERFLLQLRDATKETSQQQRGSDRCKLSAVFLEFREPFLVYGEYCSNMTNAMDTLREVTKRNAQVDQLIQQCQKEHSGGRSQLRDILSVPMQRILKYHLLLDKLVEKTSPVRVHCDAIVNLSVQFLGGLIDKRILLFCRVMKIFAAWSVPKKQWSTWRSTQTK